MMMMMMMMIIIIINRIPKLYVAFLFDSLFLPR